MRKLFIGLIITLCAGCGTLAPDYTTPEMAVPQQWPTGEAYVHQDNAEILDFDGFFQDDSLNTVIRMALDGNRNLRSKIADLEKARAVYRIARSALLPSVGLDASAGRSATTGSPADNYGLSVGLVAYEIDLFGKNRSLKDSSLESYLSSAETTNAVRISLVAETANAWVTLAADMEMLRLAESTIESASESVELAKSRYNIGVTSVLDVYQAETIYQKARADAARYTSLVAQDINALELLVGAPVPAELLPNGFNGSEGWLGVVSAGLDSEILLQRPDIAAAEHLLKSANADIGAARAAFFPSIKLTGHAGYGSDSLSSLFSNGLWSFAGMINLPIFSGGKNKAGLDKAKAQFESYAAQYDKAVQTAFREVSDTLARKGTLDEQIEAQLSLHAISKNSYELAAARYSAGVDSYLNVLTSQRTYYSAKQALISINLTELSNRITLYRALGNGNL